MIIAVVFLYTHSISGYTQCTIADGCTTISGTMFITNLVVGNNQVFCHTPNNPVVTFLNLNGNGIYRACGTGTVNFNTITHPNSATGAIELFNGADVQASVVRRDVTNFATTVDVDIFSDPCASSTANALILGGFNTSCNVIVPIILGEFSGVYQYGRVRLHWETLAEINNREFKLYRSKDNNTWKEIGTIPGQINSVTSVDYSFVDSLPYNVETNYYKFTQVDLDGKSTDSPVVPVYTESITSKKPYPSVFEDEIYLHTQSVQRVSLIDTRHLLVRDIPLETESGKITINTADVPSGTYIMKVVENGVVSYYHLMKM